MSFQTSHLSHAHFPRTLHPWCHYLCFTNTNWLPILCNYNKSTTVMSYSQINPVSRNNERINLSIILLLPESVIYITYNVSIIHCSFFTRLKLGLKSPTWKLEWPILSWPICTNMHVKYIKCIWFKMNAENCFPWKLTL